MVYYLSTKGLSFKVALFTT